MKAQLTYAGAMFASRNPRLSSDSKTGALLNCMEACCSPHGVQDLVHFTGLFPRRSQLAYIILGTRTEEAALKRFFVIAFVSSALLVGVFLTFGWYALSLEERNPLPLVLMEAMYVLSVVGFMVEQAMGYYQNDVDPSWWHPTFFISIATLFWSFVSAIALTGARALYGVIARRKPGIG